MRTGRHGDTWSNKRAPPPILPLAHHEHERAATESGCLARGELLLRHR